MAIFLDAIASGSGIDSTNAATSFSWSHTCTNTGQNAILVVGVGIGTLDHPPSGVYWGNAPLTLYRSDDQSPLTGGRTELWYLVNPEPGTRTITVKKPALTSAAGSSISFTGVDELNPLEGSAGITQGSTRPIVQTITTVNANAWTVSSALAYVVLGFFNSPTDTYVTNSFNEGSNVMAQGLGYQGPIASPSAVSVSWSAQHWSTANLSILSLKPRATASESFTTTGDQTWTVPAGVTEVVAECWGAGGRGGNAQAVVQGRAGGGGAGAYARKTIAVTPGTTINLHVGAAGSTAEASWFVDAATVKAAYGQRGRGYLDADYGVGGIGGLASDSIGDLKYGGGNGGTTTASGGGGGGGSAGRQGEGGVGGNTPNSDGGIAGVAGSDGGAAGGAGHNGGSGAGDGYPGVLYGGAGGGAGQPIFGGYTGGVGKQGKIVLNYVTGRPSIQGVSTIQGISSIQF